MSESDYQEIVERVIRLTKGWSHPLTDYLRFGEFILLWNSANYWINGSDGRAILWFSAHSSGRKWATEHQLNSILGALQNHMVLDDLSKA